MIEAKKINTSYQQAGNICMFASYSIIINYFSKNIITHKDIYPKVIKQFPGFSKKIKTQLTTTHGNDRQKVVEDMISEKYHEYCRSNGDIRGFNYIANLHDTDALATKNYCKIKGKDAIKFGHIPENDRDQLRDNLKMEGGLAMVLFPVSPNSHAVVIGFDTNDGYFIRDPNCNQIEFIDFLNTNDITEYIWFSNK